MIFSQSERKWKSNCKGGEVERKWSGVFPPCVAVIHDIGEDIFLMTAPVGKRGMR